MTYADAVRLGVTGSLVTVLLGGLLVGLVAGCAGADADDRGGAGDTLPDDTVAAVEEAYLAAFRVSKEVLREPDRSDNVDRLRDSYTGDGLAAWRNDLERALAGRLVAEEHPDRPSFAVVVGEPRPTGDDAVTVPVCEFNSDRIYERHDGVDELRYDDPVSILIEAELVDEGGVWKVRGGERVDERRDTAEWCSTVDASSLTFAD